MAQRIERFSTVTAVGDSNHVVNHTFLNGTVTHVDLYIPGGHAGLTGWRFFFGLAQLIPKTVGTVIVGDDRQFSWDIEDAPTGDNYNSVVTNNDLVAHSFHVELWIDELGTPAEDTDATPVLIVPYAV